MDGPIHTPAGPLTDDGDELTFCSSCAFSTVCLESGYDKTRLRDMHVLVEHTGPYREGQHVFREGDDFNAIAAVRAGTPVLWADPAGGLMIVRLPVAPLPGPATP